MDRRTALITAGTVAAAGAVAACTAPRDREAGPSDGGASTTATGAPAPSDGGSANPTQSPAPDGPDIDALLAGMTLEQKIGQMFVAVGYGPRADAPHPDNTSTTGESTIEGIIRTHHVGGLIYFTWAENLHDLEQIATLSRDAQQAALDSGGIPLLISTDEERGAITRLPAPATAMVGAMGLGAAGDVEHARNAGRIIAEELTACGITQTFAPDADVNIEAKNPVIGVRSFGADPDAVGRLVAAEIRALQEAGCAATPKHFPGHGDTAVDSHVGLPEIDHTRAQLEELDLPPFRAAIEAGADAIMTAHILVPALDDSGRPATLSRSILTGLLREELGFDGVIVTDSLAMEGVRTLFDDARVPVEAILAGADQMLMPPDLAVAISGVRDAVASGELTEERIDASVRRILTQKARRGLFDASPVDPAAAAERVGTQENRDAAQRAAEAALTLVAGDGDALPVAGGAMVRVVDASGTDAAKTLVEALQSEGLQAMAADGPGEGDVILALTSSEGFRTPSAQRRRVRGLVDTGTPVIHASLRNPYDAVHVGEVAASIAAYGNADCVLRALAGLVAGRISATGRLPVPIPTADGSGEAYPIGHGGG